MDIVDKLIDLREQATKEKSHYYVKSVCEEALAEIIQLRSIRDAFLAGETLFTKLRKPNAKKK